ncbi:facilitated trehalose transporter Tret1-like [Diabrotica virgifera virgifera]|uniref:Facilitated trehalose transporter Tret1-like n=1 Tax=Diabrotica virgifera virgifera TaxID=50390 RepID=A0A6P7EZY9_DIAVI|nr:facilitated trehalose transporter Tret1-like [Diabrotica virgifera virgifera]
MVKAVVAAMQKSDVRAGDDDDEKIWPQVLAILIASLGAFSQGVAFAWTSPFIVKLVEDKVNYDISEEEASNLTIVQPLTVIFTCLIFSKIPDIIGRKRTLLLLSIPHITFLLIAAFAKSIYVFYVSRMFVGLANSFLWTAMPMYIGEVASPKIRGALGTAITFGLNVGQFGVNVVGSYNDVFTTSCIFLPVPILFVALFSLMPDTPYYYLIKHQDEAARKSLRFLTRKSNVEADLKKLKSDVERQMSEQGTWKDLFCIESNRKALLAGFFLRISQMFSGNIVFVQYTQLIFKKAGGDVSPEVASIIYNVLSIVLHITVVLFVVKRFGRKPLYTWSSALSTIVLAAMAIYFYIDEILVEIDTSSLSWLPITAVVGYQVVASFGMTVMSSLMLGELFSASVKSKAMSVSMLMMAFGTFSSNAAFNFLNSNVGTYAPFLLFSVCTLISTVLSLYLVPETKDKTLEEIQMYLKGKKKSLTT